MFPHGSVLLPLPGSCAIILQFTTLNCPKSESALQTLMVKLASERGMSCLRFVAVNAFLPCAFLLFCHFEHNPSILTLLFFLNSLLNGVRFLTDDIIVFTKTRKDSRGATLLVQALFDALRSGHLLAHRIGATFTVPRPDGKAPRAEYRHLFCGLCI